MAHSTQQSTSSRQGGGSTRQAAPTDSHRRRRHRSPSTDSSSSESSTERGTTRRLGRKTSHGGYADSRRRSVSEDTYHREQARRARDKDRGRGHRQGDSNDRHRSSRRDRGGRGYESSDSDSRSRSRSRSLDKGTRKSLVEDVLSAFGIASARHAKGNDGYDTRGGSSRRHEDDRSSRYYDRDRDDRDRGIGNDKDKQMAVIRAAITAAAIEAFKSRKEPGGFTIERALRIASAAIAAGGLDAIVGRNPNSGSTRHLVESVIGGMASSQAFGHRIRGSRDPNAGTRENLKTNLMRSATRQLLGASGGGNPRRGRSYSPTRRSGSKSKSGSGLSSLLRSMTVSDRDRR